MNEPYYQRRIELFIGTRVVDGALKAVFRAPAELLAGCADHSNTDTLRGMGDIDTAVTDVIMNNSLRQPLKDAQLVEYHRGFQALKR